MLVLGFKWVCNICVVLFGLRELLSWIRPLLAKSCLVFVRKGFHPSAQLCNTYLAWCSQLQVPVCVYGCRCRIDTPSKHPPLLSESTSTPSGLKSVTIWSMSCIRDFRAPWSNNSALLGSVFGSSCCRRGYWTFQSRGVCWESAWGELA